MRALAELSRANSGSNLRNGLRVATGRAQSETQSESADIHEQLPAVDYLIIGAGAAAMAFVDTLLKENPNLQIAIVDKNLQPGGHWVHAYDFVRLHQPSVVYGCETQLLEGSWWKHFLRLRAPWAHRASKKEIIDYFGCVLDSWVAKNGAMFYGGCWYDLEQLARCDKDGDKHLSRVHTFASTDGSTKYRVHVRQKLINGIMMECKVPINTPLTIPIAPEVKVMTVNSLATVTSDRNVKYVVLGAGKTGMDAVVHLQATMGVDPSNITWIIPADVWMLNRSKASPTAYVEELLRQHGDKEATADALYERGLFIRLDPFVRPTRYRFPMIGEDELALLRKVTDVVRRGRATSIGLADDGTHHPTIGFGDGAPPRVVASHATDVVFVHCAAPGPFNGCDPWTIFESDRVLNLAMMFAPPISISASCLAALESARLKGTLDLEFGRALLGKCASENEILNSLVRNFKTSDADRPFDSLRTMTNLAHFLALLDKDPSVGAHFMKANRLSMYSIPGSKMSICDNLERISQDHKALQLTTKELEWLELARRKLTDIEGA